MKKALVFLLFIGCLALTGCDNPDPATTPTPTLPAVSPTVLQRFPTPTLTLTPTPVPTAGDTSYQLQGVFFVMPKCLSAAPSVSIVQAVLPDPNAGPLMYFPQHRQIVLDRYPLQEKYFVPLIRVFPVAEFAAMTELTAGRVTRMSELLETQTWKPGDTIPLLPGYSMMQVFQAQVKFLDFKNGRGIRWLTELAQYSAPVNNRDLFYSYQGVTSDGEYWVSVMLPVNAAYLQETYDSTEVPTTGLAFPAPGSTILAQELESYYTLMLRLLNNTPDAGFTPALDCLDQLVSSIAVSD